MRGIERLIAVFLLSGGLAGAAVFAHRAGAPVDAPFTAALVQPASHSSDSSTILRTAAVPALPAIAVFRKAPVVRPRPFHLAAPVTHAVPVPTPTRVTPIAATPRPTQPAPEPDAPVAAPAPEVPKAPTPVPPPTPAPPAPTPTPPPATPPAEVPSVPPAPPVTTAPAVHDHGNGKAKGKEKQKEKGKDEDEEVGPVAETLEPAPPVAPAVAPTDVVPVNAAPPATAEPSEDGKHGRGHGKDK